MNWQTSIYKRSGTGFFPELKVKSFCQTTNIKRIKDVLCSPVYFRETFEIINKFLCDFITSVSAIFHTSLYTCSLQGFPLHLPPLCLSIQLASANSRATNFLQGGVQDSSYMFLLSLQILHLLLGNLLVIALLDLCHNHMNKP